MEGKIRVGCIADDFTGASDAASFLRRQGMKTVLFNGLPEEKLPENCDAIVVALKSRTAPVKEAVNDSIQALKWMKAQGAAQLYIKYCSTFDSTKEGNIGPILVQRWKHLIFRIRWYVHHFRSMEERLKKDLCL